jgi:hypothetical protein
MPVLDKNKRMAMARRIIPKIFVRIRIPVGLSNLSTIFVALSTRYTRTIFKLSAKKMVQLS